MTVLCVFADHRHETCPNICGYLTFDSSWRKSVDVKGEESEENKKENKKKKQKSQKKSL